MVNFQLCELWIGHVALPEVNPLSIIYMQIIQTVIERTLLAAQVLDCAFTGFVWTYSYGAIMFFITLKTGCQKQTSYLLASNPLVPIEDVNLLKLDHKYIV